MNTEQYLTKEVFKLLDEKLIYRIFVEVEQWYSINASGIKAIIERRQRLITELESTLNTAQSFYDDDEPKFKALIDELNVRIADEHETIAQLETEIKEWDFVNLSKDCLSNDDFMSLPRGLRLEVAKHKTAAISELTN